MALIQQHRFQLRTDTDFAPIGLDEPYRVFISEDPIGFEGGINIFIYALNNPATLYDPNGLDPRGWDNPYPSHSLNRRNGDSPYQIDNSVLRCHVATHNDPGDTIKGVAAIAAVTLAPVAIKATAIGGAAAARAATTVAITNPQVVQHAIDVVEGFVSPGPPSTPTLSNYIGSGAGWAYDKYVAGGSGKGN